MKIEEIEIKKLIPYANNPRLNTNAVLPVAESIKEFGFKIPIIIDKDNVIVCGHTRYEAAKSLKMEKVPCIRADDLSEEQIKAFRLADNKTAEFATWDDFKLGNELEELFAEEFDMERFGFLAEEDEEDEKKEKEREIPEMELGDFESYDYLVFVFNNKNDFITACNTFNIQKVRGLGKKHGKIGLGRIIRGEKLAERLRFDDSSDQQGTGGQDDNAENPA